MNLFLHTCHHTDFAVDDYNGNGIDAAAAAADDDDDRDYHCSERREDQLLNSSQHIHHVGE